jgi:hypothetical protein
VTVAGIKSYIGKLVLSLYASKEKVREEYIIELASSLVSASLGILINYEAENRHTVRFKKIQPKIDKIL